MRVYATPSDLATFTGEAAPANAIALLARATRLVEGLTTTALYAVDEDGLPEDLDISEAFRDAVCAQAAWFDETGDVSGAGARFNSLSLGSFSASGGGTGAATNTSAAQSRYSPEAVEILRSAGLLTQAPVSL